MEYVDVKCIQKVWVRYKQIHMYVPAVVWVADPKSDDYNYGYWSLIPIKLWDQIQKDEIFKPFREVADTVYIFNYVLVGMHGFIDELVEMDSLLISGEEMLAPISDSYAIYVNKGQLHSFIHIGKCVNYWDVPVSSITFSNNVYGFNISKKSSLANSSCINSGSVLIKRHYGRDLWDKLIKWVCIDLVANPDAPVPINLSYDDFSTSIHYSIGYINSKLKDGEVKTEIIGKLDDTFKSIEVCKRDFFEQFGITNELEWRNW